MGISLNPLDIWNYFVKRKETDRARIAEWLDGVAKEARELADVWLETCGKLGDGPAFTRAEKWRRLFPPNVRPLEKLVGFYRTASEVMGGRVDLDTSMRFFQSLGELLASREVTKREYDEIVDAYSSMIFVGSENEVKDLHNIFELTMVLNREAAALEVLAKNFRAMK